MCLLNNTPDFSVTLDGQFSSYKICLPVDCPCSLQFYTLCPDGLREKACRGRIPKSLKFVMEYAVDFQY
jgi:hypothetical protein